MLAKFMASLSESSDPCVSLKVCFHQPMCLDLHDYLRLPICARLRHDDVQMFLLASQVAKNRRQYDYDEQNDGHDDREDQQPIGLASTAVVEIGNRLEVLIALLDPHEDRVRVVVEKLVFVDSPDRLAVPRVSQVQFTELQLHVRTEADILLGMHEIHMIVVELEVNVLRSGGGRLGVHRDAFKENSQRPRPYSGGFLTFESSVMQHVHRVVTKYSAVGNIHHKCLALYDTERRIVNSQSLNFFHVERARLKQCEVRTFDSDASNVTVVKRSRRGVHLKGRVKDFEIVDGQFLESLRVDFPDLRVFEFHHADVTEEAG